MKFSPGIGNKYGEKALGKVKSKNNAWWNIAGWLIGDGGHKFKDLIKKQSEGKDLNDAEEKFLEHFKDLMEYHQPKLARTELVGDKEKPLQINVD